MLRIQDQGYGDAPITPSHPYLLISQISKWISYNSNVRSVPSVRDWSVVLGMVACEVPGDDARVIDVSKKEKDGV